MENKEWVYYGILVLAMLFWGGSWVSAKILVSIAPPMTIGFFRFLIASLLFVPILMWENNGKSMRIKTQHLLIILQLGLTGVFGYGVLFLIGLRFTTSAQGAIIAGINPAIVCIFAHFLHNERLGKRWQYVGFIVSFMGVVFVIGVQSLIDFQPEYLLGNLIIVGSMILWGLYSSLAKTAMDTLSIIEATAGGVFVGAVFFGACAITEGFWVLQIMHDSIFWINIFFLGSLVTLVSFLIFLKSIEELGATRAGGFINLVPVFGTLLSVLILNESLFWTFHLGLILVILGITFISHGNDQYNKPKTEISVRHNYGLRFGDLEKRLC
jgi:drug/metabolite transporter (DMT)-like permease